MFTSAAEVAALDPQLTVRSAPTRQILDFVLDSDAVAICINAIAPVTTLPTAQLREMLELVTQHEQDLAESQGEQPEGSTDDVAAPGV